MFEYKKEQTHIYYNQYDADLGGKNGEFAICLEIPTVESFFAYKNLPYEELIKEIPGYGLSPKKQKFDYYRDKMKIFEVPAKIQTLVQTLADELSRKEKKPVFPEPEQIWDAIEENPAEYESELQWIKTTKNRWIDGWFCFINGRPTYIDGDHYFYLGFYPIMNRSREDGLPFYRDIDRRTFIFLKWAETTTDAYYTFKLTCKEKGKIVERYFNLKNSALMYVKRMGINYYELDEGFYVIDTSKGGTVKGERTIAGVVWATRRGQGKTYIMGCKGVCRTLRAKGERFIIQARSETTAKDDVYTEKVKIPFLAVPFFFKPSHRVYEEKIVFSPKNRGAIDLGLSPHNGQILIRTSKMTSVDGNRLWTYGNDESGKDEQGGIVEDHMGTIRETLSVSNEIIGFAMYFSTFGQFTGGGREFFQLFMMSVNHKRTDIGRTPSWLVALFNPAFDGFDKCIDEFGESIIEDPEEPYINLKGELMHIGGRTYLNGERLAAKEIGDYETYDYLVRNNPFNIREASRPPQAQDTWDMEGLNKQIEYLQFDTEAPQGREVNLEWEGGSMFKHKEVNGILLKTNELSNVLIKDAEPGKGKFKMYIQPADEWKNKKEYDSISGWWGPSQSVRHRFVLGTDPFAYDLKDTRSKKLSKGGGVMHYKRDFQADPDGTPRNIWKSRTTALTYLYRPDTTDEYAEDMLMAAVLYGSYVSTETNVTVILKKFREWKVWGYILYLIDPVTGRLNDFPGVRTQGEEKQRLLNSVRDYVRYDIQRESSLELCEQISQVETPDDLPKNDLVAALGVALMGSESHYADVMDQSSNVFDGTDLYDFALDGE
jgi:hypothetical protein